MNIGVHVSFSIIVATGYMSSSGITGSYDSFSTSFSKGISILASPVAQRVKSEMKVLVTQSCLTLCDPKDCGPPVSSAHGVL